MIKVYMVLDAEVSFKDSEMRYAYDTVFTNIDELHAHLHAKGKPYYLASQKSYDYDGAYNSFDEDFVSHTLVIYKNLGE